MDADDKRDPIPETFESIEEAAEFWDVHDLGDYWDETSKVDFEVDLEHRTVLVPLEEQIARRLLDVARRQGISTETLVNVWLSERLREVV